MLDRRAEPGAQPTNLPAMIDLVLGHVEPRPVRIHCGSRAKRLLQPFIVASGKTRERDPSRLGELVKVVFERLVS